MLTFDAVVYNMNDFGCIKSVKSFVIRQAPKYVEVINGAKQSTYEHVKDFCC